MATQVRWRNGNAVCIVSNVSYNLESACSREKAPFCAATKYPPTGSTLSELASVSGVGGCALKPLGTKRLPGAEGPSETKRKRKRRCSLVPVDFLRVLGGTSLCERTPTHGSTSTHGDSHGNTPRLGAVCLAHSYSHRNMPRLSSAVPIQDYHRVQVP